MGQLPAAEEQIDPNLIAFREEFPNILQFYLEVMVIYLGADPDEFELRGFLLTVRIFVPFALLILELTIVHNPAHRGLPIGGNLDQIQIPLRGCLQGISAGHNAELGSAFVNNPHLSSANHFIDPKLFDYEYSPPVAAV